MTAPPVLEARSVTRLIGEAAEEVALVRDISMKVDPGEFVAIVGASGSGKSSLLYLLGLLDRPSSGEILVDGAPTGPMSSDELASLRLKRIGFVFQFHFLLPEFTALDNVLLPMRKLGKLGEAEMQRRGLKILDDLGLKGHEHKRPDKLSGGERQRVAIARALANAPGVILADEPTGNLDSRNSRIVFDLFRHLVRDEGASVVVITHDDHLAAECDRRVRIADGRLVEFV